MILCCLLVVVVEANAFIHTDLGNNTSVGVGFRIPMGDLDYRYLSSTLVLGGLTTETVTFTVEACCLQCGNCEDNRCGITFWGDWTVTSSNNVQSFPAGFDSGPFVCTMCDSILISTTLFPGSQGPPQLPPNFAVGNSTGITVNVITECVCCDHPWSPAGLAWEEFEMLPYVP